MNTGTQKIWLITGISSGLGKAIAEAAINAGDYVVGTMRNSVQIEAFNAAYSEKARAIQADMTRAEDIKLLMQTVEHKYGRLDVLVNNAGVGFVGAAEEASIDEIRKVLEPNFFGAVHLTQAALPLLRKQQSGHIVQISSHGGVKAFAGFGIYNASKFALEGYSEALAQEIAPLGIRLTIVEPGPFRTNFAGASLLEAARHLDDYAATAGALRKRMKEVVHGNQEGNPDKAANAIVSLVHSDTAPPLRLPLGKIAVQSISTKISSLQNDLDAWRHVAEATVY